MGKNEEQLEEELRRMKLRYQEVKKGKVRYNSGIKKVIAIMSVLAVLLLISYISISNKHLFINEVTKNVKFKKEKKYTQRKEATLEDTLLILNVDSATNKVYITNGNSEDKIVVKSDRVDIDVKKAWYMYLQ